MESQTNDSMLPETMETMGSNNFDVNSAVHLDGNQYMVNFQLEQSEFCTTPRRNNMLPFCGSSCTPVCEEEEKKPRVGMVFDSLADAEDFYKSYGHQVGFGVRVGQSTKNEDGLLIWQRYLCSKEGFRSTKEDATKKGKETSDGGKGKLVKKKTKSVKITRCGCEAKIALKKEDDKYKITVFVKSHTHVLVSPSKQQFIRSNREVSDSIKNALFVGQKANIGTSGVYRMQQAERGGFDNIGCTKRDLQNYERDFKCAIQLSDAQMFIDCLERRKVGNPTFFYECEKDDKDRLMHVFWADSIARKNYALFGDVVSFDATYGTNQYNMVFTPFTGVDHHMGCVSFGAAFLASEREESYTWLFKTFLKAMRWKEPSLMCTDECPSMKAAFHKVFTTTKHRYCMWHILRKLPEKVGPLNSYKNFHDKLSECVWGSETPAEFELAWSSIINNFGLEGNEWLSSKYAMRDDWIPAFFTDVHLGAILRTTSRSESTNAYFGHFVTKRLPLVQFWAQFENAMDTQRYQQLLSDHNTVSKMPQLKSNWSMEESARDVFTHEIFIKFQDELVAARDGCVARSIANLEEVTVQGILEKRTGKLREVRYNNATKNAQCSCRKFESLGIPCRHIILVLDGALLDELPSYFVLERWTKNVTKKEVVDVDGNIIQDGPSNPTDIKIKKLYSDIRRRIDTILQVAERDEEKMEHFKNVIFDATDPIIEMHSTVKQTKLQEFEAYLGCTIPTQAHIHPPTEIRTKGCGKRLKGGAEKAIEKQNKPPRLCKICKQKGFHDSRNCPNK